MSDSLPHFWGYNGLPYTDFHELNLDWILSVVKKLAAKFDEWQELAEALEKLWKDLPGMFEENSKTDQAYADKVAQESLEAANAHSDQQDALQNSEWAEKFAHGFYELTKAWQRGDALVENKVKLWFSILWENLKRVPLPAVQNPFTGQVDSVQNVLNDIYNHFRYEAFTAQEFDDYGQTAEWWDSLGLTALDYDLYAKRLSGWWENYWFRDYFLMRDPFDGQMKPQKEVIYELAALHQNGYTAEEMDSWELTAQEYDDMGYTARNFDWTQWRAGARETTANYGLPKFHKGDFAEIEDMTAEQLDARGLTAAELDGLRIPKGD